LSADVVVLREWNGGFISVAEPFATEGIPMSLAAGGVGELPGEAAKRFDDGVRIPVEECGVEHDLGVLCEQSVSAVIQQAKEVAAGCNDDGPVGQEQSFTESFADGCEGDGTIDGSNGQGLVGGSCFCTDADADAASLRVKAGLVEDGFTHFGDGSLRLANHLMEIAFRGPARGVERAVQGNDETGMCLRGNADCEEGVGKGLCWRLRWDGRMGGDSGGWQRGSGISGLGNGGRHTLTLNQRGDWLAVIQDWATRAICWCSG
jgi:hypothetical protein